MTLRPAQIDDCEIVLNWRNDPETIKSTSSQKPVEPREHLLWFTLSLKSPNRLIFIVENSQNEPVGMGRLDFISDWAELSVIVAPEFRHNGIAVEIIRELCRRAKGMGKMPMAKVRSDNPASLISFIKAGMRPEGEMVCFR